MLHLRQFLLCAVFVFTGITSELVFKSDTTNIPAQEAPVWNRRCRTDADCVPGFRQICNLTTGSCACPRFAFKPITSNVCKNQVIVDVETDDEGALILRDFEKFRRLVSLRLNISPHSVPSSLHRNSVRIFVDAKLFEPEWNESALEDLMNFPKVNGAMRTTILSDVCKHSESNPCDENSICLVKKLKYDVQCVCKPGFRSSFNGIGTVCERQRLCINGGTDSPAISACECHVLFWGDHCEINLFRVSLTIILLLMVIYKIFENLRDCLKNFDRQDPQPTKVNAISYDYVENGHIKRRTVYSEDARRWMGAV